MSINTRSSIFPPSWQLPKLTTRPIDFDEPLFLNTRPPLTKKCKHYKNYRSTLVKKCKIRRHHTTDYYKKYKYKSGIKKLTKEKSFISAKTILHLSYKFWRCCVIKDSCMDYSFMTHQPQQLANLIEHFNLDDYNLPNNQGLKRKLEIDEEMIDNTVIDGDGDVIMEEADKMIVIGDVRYIQINNKRRRLIETSRLFSLTTTITRRNQSLMLMKRKHDQVEEQVNYRAFTKTHGDIFNKLIVKDGVRYIQNNNKRRLLTRD